MRERTPDLSMSPEVVVIREGRLVRDGSAIIEASSTVTMIRSEGTLVLVDTGSPAEIDRLREALLSVHIDAGDVDIVVNTHLHLDHAGGNGLFRNARFYAHGLESPPVGTIRVKDEVDLLPDVRILHTPGHTAGSVSVLVNGSRRYAICGDAVPTRANLENHVPPVINIDPRLALKSMEVLERSADIIVPGHENAFEVARKK